MTDELYWPDPNRLPKTWTQFFIRLAALTAAIIAALYAAAGVWWVGEHIIWWLVEAVTRLV